MFAEMVRDGAVDGRVYTSREVFTAEIERIFTRSWNYIGHLSEIPQPGDYRRVTVAGRPLIFIRHEDGTPRVLLNRCAHRGAAVVGRDCGQARRLRCPYHGWTYATDGALRQFPLPGGYAGEDAPRRGDPDWSLESYPVETYRNFAGRFTFRLTPGGAGFRIREKRVDLINSDAPHEPLEVFF